MIQFNDGCGKETRQQRLFRRIILCYCSSFYLITLKVTFSYFYVELTYHTIQIYRIGER